MKRKLVFTAIITMLLVSALNAYADIGVPEGTRIKMVIKPQGADYYLDVDSDNPESAGRLDGGTEFYGLSGLGEKGFHYGTTDVNAADGEEGKFIYVRTEDTESDKTEVSSDVGVKTPHTEAVTTDDLNLRYGPGTGYAVIEVLPKDTTVNYEYTCDTDVTWMYVSVDGKVGWVSGDYLKTVHVEKTDEDKPEAEITEEPPAENEDVDIADDEKNDEQQSTFGKEMYIILIACVLVSAAIAAIITYLLLRKNSKS